MSKVQSTNKITNLPTQIQLCQRQLVYSMLEWHYFPFHLSHAADCSFRLVWFCRWPHSDVVHCHPEVLVYRLKWAHWRHLQVPKLKIFIQRLKICEFGVNICEYIPPMWNDWRLRCFARNSWLKLMLMNKFRIGTVSCFIDAFLIKENRFFLAQPTQQIIVIVSYQLIQRNWPEQRFTIAAVTHSLDFWTHFSLKCRSGQIYNLQAKIQSWP